MIDFLALKLLNIKFLLIITFLQFFIILTIIIYERKNLFKYFKTKKRDYIFLLILVFAGFILKLNISYPVMYGDDTIYTQLAYT